MKQLPLYMFKNVFGDGKSRPGFVIKEQLFVLSSQPSANAVWVKGSNVLIAPHIVIDKHEHLYLVPRRYPASSSIFAGVLILPREIEKYLKPLVGDLTGYVFKTNVEKRIFTSPT